MSVVVTGIRRTDRSLVDAFADHGVATIHEAQGRGATSLRGCSRSTPACASPEPP